MATLIRVTRNGKPVSRAQVIDAVFDITHERVAASRPCVNNWELWEVSTNEIFPEINEMPATGLGYRVEFIKRR